MSKYINCCLFCYHWGGRNAEGQYNIKYCVKKEKQTHRRDKCDGFQPDNAILEDLRKNYKNDEHMKKLLSYYEVQND